MNHRLIALALGVLGSGLVSPLAGAEPIGHLVWSDEFNQQVGTTPDLSKWSFDLGGNGWGNRELESYTAEPKNCSVVADPDATDGKALAITAVRSATDGSFTSARLKTAGKFVSTYGRFEARLKLPVGQGVWPAFWLLSSRVGKVRWPKCGEIDIMENLGSDPTKVFGTLHGPGYSAQHGIQGKYRLPDESYHVYAVEWSPNRLEWSVDGHVYQTLTPESLPKGTAWVFNDNPFFIILNLAIGGSWGGYPNKSTMFPQTMRVDYVRVYALPSQ